VRSPPETVEAAQQLLDARLPFQAHEVFEDAWKSSPGVDRGLWKGLAQLAVGLTHLDRGNLPGAKTLLRRGIDAIAPFAAEPEYGIDVAGIALWATDLAARLDVARAPADVLWTAPTLRRQ
jgi:predicted metal-dependent hydrolase